MTPPKIYGLIGYPVKHSLSPAMHNAAFKALKINAEYRLFEIKPEETGNFIRALRKNNIYGINVTVPYKEKAMSFLDAVSQEAELIGAVNTIKVSGNRLEGFNSDGEGFLRHLTGDLGFDPKDKIIAIIGAGGAAKAIAVYLSQKNPKAVIIYDVDRAKSETLVNHLKGNFNNIDFAGAGSIDALNIPRCNLLVNATPVGMRESDPALVDERFLHEGLLVYDLIYNPAQTKLLKAAKQKGAGISNGLGMLLYQGAAAFEVWTGEKAPVEIMRQALEEGIKKCSGKS